jgi:DNA-binding SARP family transcriptional activator
VARTGTSKLTVELFGGVRVARDDEPIDLPHSSQALLGYLLLQRAQRATRPVLIELVAPDQPPDSARRRLNTAVWRLRRSLEPDGRPRDSVLRADPGTLMINPDCEIWVDAVEFERACERHRSRTAEWSPADVREVTEAVERYRGELLPGVDDEWAVLRRGRLANLYLASLVGLTHWHRRVGDPTTALHWIDTALAADPPNELLHRIAMTTYAEAGMRELIDQQFEHCAKSLASIGAHPSDDTVALRRRLLGGHRTDHASTAEIRDTLADLEAALAEVERLGRRLERMAAHLRRSVDSGSGTSV